MTIIKIQRSQLFYSIALFLIMGIICGIINLEYNAEQELAAIENQPIRPPVGTVSIAIKVSQRILELRSDGQVYQQDRIAIGKRWMGVNVPWGIYGIQIPISHSRLDNLSVMTLFICEIKMWKNYLNGYQWEPMYLLKVTK